MILFLADNHYTTHPGRQLFTALGCGPEWRFSEDTLEPLKQDLETCRLVVLHLICGTPGSPLPDSVIESSLRRYVDSGKPLLLLHGASAAFSCWAWWRDLAGLRWVRPDDPDGLPASFHPVAPYEITLCPGAPAPADRLRPFCLPQDEIYLGLAQTSPITPLMQTCWEGKPHVQCFTKATSAGGRLASFLPGHRKEAVQHEAVLHSVRVLIEWLLEDS